MPDLTAHAFDIMCWRFRRPKRDMNFPDAESLEMLEFIGLEVHIVSCKEKMGKCIMLDQCNTRESNAVAMTRIAAEHLHLVQAEYLFFSSRDSQHNKAESALSLNCGLGMAVPLQ